MLKLIIFIILVLDFKIINEKTRIYNWMVFFYLAIHPSGIYIYISIRDIPKLRSHDRLKRTCSYHTIELYLFRLLQPPKRSSILAIQFDFDINCISTKRDNESQIPIGSVYEKLLLTLRIQWQFAIWYLSIDTTY